MKVQDFFGEKYMELLFSFNWISLLALAVVFLLFGLIWYLSNKINWTFVILISLVLGVIVGIVFASEDNVYLKWVDLIGDIYVSIITALVAPVILVSIISSFIQLKDGNSIKKIGFRSVFWLLLSAFVAIVLSIIAGVVTGLGKNAGAIFSEISNVSSGTIGAYQGLTKSFDEVILGLFPSNLVGDLSANNVVSIIITGVAIAIAYIAVAKEKGEEKIGVFKKFIESVKEILYKILSFVIDLTPFAVLSLIAGSASKIFSNKDAIIQLLLLVVAIYVVCAIHTYGYHALILKFVAKVNPFKFFKKTSRAQATAFTTQSSVGTLPVTINDLTRNVGVDSEVANFTAPLGATIGMPGCTAVWPVLLAIFFVNATGAQWGVGNYIVLAILALVMSLGSAGVPGIAVVTAIGLFGILDLPVAAVILLMPINTISDMVRTLDNVTTASVSATIVASQSGLLDRQIFEEKKKDQEQGGIVDGEAI